MNAQKYMIFFQLFVEKCYIFVALESC